MSFKFDYDEYKNNTPEGYDYSVDDFDYEYSEEFDLDLDGDSIQDEFYD